MVFVPVTTMRLQPALLFSSVSAVLGQICYYTYGNWADEEAPGGEVEVLGGCMLLRRRSTLLELDGGQKHAPVSAQCKSPATGLRFQAAGAMNTAAA
jgi:hypothetical protein